MDEKNHNSYYAQREKVYMNGKIFIGHQYKNIVFLITILFHTVFL